MRDSAPTRKTWPEGCYGSALSWLLFIGPSPGGKLPAQSSLAQRNPKGGRCLWNVAFDQPYADRPDAWRGKYRENMPALVETIIGLPLNRGGAKLYGFANFDWVPSPQEGRVPRERLLQGEATVMKVLKLTRPRIIAPTTKLAYAQLLRCLSGQRYTFLHRQNSLFKFVSTPLGQRFTRAWMS